MPNPSLTCNLDDVAIELWIDDPVSRVAKSAYFDLLDAHGVDGIAVMVDDSRRAWNPKYSDKTIAKIGDLCAEHGKSLAITDWPYPDKAVLNAMAKGMERLILSTGLEQVEWEDDMEFNWHPRKVKGFRRRDGRSALDLAGDYWVAKKQEVIEWLQARYGIEVINALTTFTSHTENGRAADVAPHMDILFQQAYAVRNRKKKDPRTGKYTLNWTVPQDHSYGPGNMVKHTLDRTMQVPGIDDGHPELGCGLALYDQGRWPMGPDAAVMLCIDVAVGQFGVKVIRFWSSKWAIGAKSRSSPYGKRILKTLAKARGRI